MWYSCVFALEETPDAGTPFRELSFTVLTDQNDIPCPVVLRPETAVVFGENGGTWIGWEEMEIAE